MKYFSRRQFLALSAGGASAFLLSQAIGNERSLGIQSQPLSPVIASQAGILDLELEAKAHSIRIGDRTGHLLAYGGRIPGPRLEIAAGDRVRLQFVNSLPQPTNLHFHGLHVTPTGSGDNPFRQIESGESFVYEFDIPPDHPGLMAWYHPHRHGLVAEQLFGGLAGLAIVRGTLDEIPEVKAAREEFLILQDFNLDRQGLLAPLPPMARIVGREGNLQTVNGTVRPDFEIVAGGLLRLRLLNASPSRFYRLQLEGHSFHLIATDGGALSTPVALQELLLVPGERADVLVQGDRSSGQYRLLNLPYDRGGMGMMGGGMMGRGMMGRGTMGRGMMGPQAVPERGGNPTTLASLTYRGSVEPLPLPERLIAVEPLPEPTETRRFVLNHGMAPRMGMVFSIDGRAFDSRRVDTRVPLDGVEDWEIVNAGTMDHPFHLHVHPFQVVSHNDRPEPYRAWKDTVLVRVGERVRLRLRFADFPGKTVYHCHILDHEDLGMMGTIEVMA